MMKSEFIDHVNALGKGLTFESLSDDDYRVIEHVYNYHPAIDNKEDIAKIYCLRGGFQIIKDMWSTANEWAQKEQEIMKLRKQADEINSKLKAYSEERKAISGV